LNILVGFKTFPARIVCTVFVLGNYFRKAKWRTSTERKRIFQYLLQIFYIWWKHSSNSSSDGAVFTRRGKVY